MIVSASGRIFIFCNPLVFSVAVPEKIIGLTLSLDFFDRCHASASLLLPLAALGSVPPLKGGRARTAPNRSLCKGERPELHPTAYFTRGKGWSCAQPLPFKGAGGEAV